MAPYSGNIGAMGKISIFYQASTPEKNVLHRLTGKGDAKKNMPPYGYLFQRFMQLRISRRIIMAFQTFLLENATLGCKHGYSNISMNERRKKMKRTKINIVFGRLLPTFILLSLVVLLAGCVGLSSRVATCPLNKATCADSALQEIKLAKEPYVVSPTFVILVTHAQGPITSVSATVTDSFGTTVNIDPTDISKPNTHTLIDPSYWAVRLDWPKLSAKGIRVEPGQDVWTVVINTTLDNKHDDMTLKFSISN